MSFMARPDDITRSANARREILRQLAWLLDSSIRIPGTRFTIGIDALLGLVPFAGDLLGVLLSSYILLEAARLGAPKPLLYRMAINVAVDGLVGAIPVAGDIFDAVWKANQKNVRLLEAHLREPARTAAASRRWIILIALGAIVLAIGALWLTYVLLRWLWSLVAS
jgi:hypothetical protein